MQGSDSLEGSNWAGNVVFGAIRRVAPCSVEGLQEIVAACDRARPVGTRHSFSPIADTAGTLISTARLPAVLRIDAGAREVTVSAGTRYGYLAGELHARGWALPNLGSLPHISVAGGCATATHGSGDRNGNLATSVVALDLVTANGELVTVRRDVDGDFAGHVVALGALGVVVTVTLAIVPTFHVRQHVYRGLTRVTLLERLDEIFAAAYSVSVFTCWRPESSRLWVKQRVEPTGETTAAPVENFGVRALEQPDHPVPGADPVHTTGQLGVPGPWHERLPHFRMGFTPSSGDELQSEYFVSRDDARAAIERIFHIGDQIRPALQVSELRTIAADDLWLSPAYGRDAVSLHFTWRPDEAAVARAVAAVERQLAPFQPRPHWGKVFALPAASIRATYPRLGDFLALADRRDPTGVFRNTFLASTVGLR
ncbi:FAD-binding protein [Frankia sp. AgKG'84/4]|uniref:FAD-binding protein n=1 Tax=Frankia sp. AgKG'84/4 TaxID=573490 RepID=UPI00200D20D8|nr:FAD-binding protein [Frankia sp. AgKG'84/4]MCL9794076.1 FAD-binding protein [Frankia sp. AgKG'84/4]